MKRLIGSTHQLSGISCSAWCGMLSLALAAAGFAGAAADSRRILTTLAWHAFVLMLPFVAAVLDAVRRGITTPVLLMLWGAAASGWAALMSLSCVFLDAQWGWLLIIVMLGACLVAIVRWRSLLISAAVVRVMAPLGLCVLYAGILLLLTLVPSGMSEPLEFVRSRYSHPLPADNVLPLLFARNFLAAVFPTPMIGDWLGSDRPPLQSAYFVVTSLGLPELFGGQRSQDLAYQVQGTLLQSFWLAGMWALLVALRLPAAARWGAMALCAVSGLAFVHSVFVWPKLFPVLHLCLIAAAVAVPGCPRFSNWRIGALIGCNAALAFLCHGGSIFALAGLAVYVILVGRIPKVQFLVAALVAGLLVSFPWSLYQRYFDPPGDRLLKWHLAGVVQVDSRPLTSVLLAAYRELTWQEFVRSKLTDVAMITGNPGMWALLQFKALGLHFSTSEVLELRRAQFESILATTGFFGWVPVAWFALRRHGAAVTMRAGEMLLGVAMATLVVWTLLMYEPGATSIHQGSLATAGFLMGGSFLICFAFSRPLGWLLLAMQLFVTIRIYLVALPGSAAWGLVLLGAFDWALVIGLAGVSAWLARCATHD